MFLCTQVVIFVYCASTDCINDKGGRLNMCASQVKWFLVISLHSPFPACSCRVKNWFRRDLYQMIARSQVFAPSSSWALAVLFPCRLLAAHPLSGTKTTYAHAYAMASGWSVQLALSYEDTVWSCSCVVRHIQIIAFVLYKSNGHYLNNFWVIGRLKRTLKITQYTFSTMCWTVFHDAVWADL